MISEFVAAHFLNRLKSVYLCCMKKVLFLFLLFLVRAQAEAFAQDRAGEDCASDLTMKVSAMLDSITAENFKASRIQGFRILLYSGNEREAAVRAKETAYGIFPKADVYMAYSAPTFKVRLGDFYSRLDAWQQLLKLRSQFPQAVITNEIVTVKP